MKFFTVPPGGITLTGYTTGTSLSLGDVVSVSCETCSGNPAPLVRWTETTINTELDSTVAAGNEVNVDALFRSV